MSVSNIYQSAISNVDLNTISHILSPDNLNINDSVGEKSFYSPDDFNDYITHRAIHDSNLSMIHMNCRSILRNFDDIHSLLDTLSITFSAIAVTETWLRDDSNLCNIQCYKFERTNRESRRGGGVGVYIQDKITYKCRKDLDLNGDHMESIFVELDNVNAKNVILGVVYRPPGQSIQSFFFIP